MLLGRVRALLAAHQRPGAEKPLEAQLRDVRCYPEERVGLAWSHIAICLAAGDLTERPGAVFWSLLAWGGIRVPWRSGASPNPAQVAGLLEKLSAPARQRIPALHGVPEGEEILPPRPATIQDALAELGRSL